MSPAAYAFACHNGQLPDTDDDETETDELDTNEDDEIAEDDESAEDDVPPEHNPPSFQNHESPPEQLNGASHTPGLFCAIKTLGVVQLTYLDPLVIAELAGLTHTGIPEHAPVATDDDDVADDTTTDEELTADDVADDEDVADDTATTDDELTADEDTPPKLYLLTTILDARALANGPLSVVFI